MAEQNGSDVTLQQLDQSPPEKSLTTLRARKALRIAGSAALRIPTLILVWLMVGASGLHLLTGQGFLHSFYLAFIMLSTVGSQEPTPLDDGTKVFIIIYLALGLGIFAYSGFKFGQILLSSDLRSLWERRRMEKLIAQMSGHFIICGYGRMGRELSAYLHARNEPFVIIDEDESLLTPEMKEDGWMFLTGDAANDETLERAGILHARGLTTVLPTDADNLYVVLSARLLNSQIPIVARAADDRAAHKMRQAGATRVINPLSSGAIRMARFMISPSIENFVEVAESRGLDWEIADVNIPDSSPLINQALKDTPLREAGIMLLGVCRESGDTYFPPPGDLTLHANDNLFAFGSSENLKRLNDLLLGN